jgi:D-tyrosyl-tRNA(Tyr) deacylase
MRAVIQRVTGAILQVANTKVAAIGAGLVVLLGIEAMDTDEDIEWLCAKTVNLRIFSDQQGVMNLSVREVSGEILLVSQFTLHASTRKGNRPSYIRAARPEIAKPLFDQTISTLQREIGGKIQTGIFGADMQVTLTNDGPVTIVIDTKDRE